MDIEQLKLVIDLLRDAGEVSVWLIGAYIVVWGLVPYVLGFFALFLGYRLASAAIQAIYSTSATIGHFKVWRGHLRTGVSGMLIPEETERTAKAINDILSQSRKDK